MRALIGGITAAFVLAATGAEAGPRDKAKLLFERIAGVPATTATLDAMETHLKAGRHAEAAAIPLASPFFYNLAIKNWVTSWTNAERAADQPLNDYTATVIGMIRDEVPFDQVLYGDIIYTSPLAGTTVNGTAIRAYSNADNNHYADLETANVDLSKEANLRREVQSAANRMGIADTAGVLTTRASGAAFFSAGTNRRVFRFAAINYLCRDLDALQDTTVSDFRVRRDVLRDPGGDLNVFKTKCVGCHGLQDGLGGAFAFFNFDNGKLLHTPGTVQGKYNINTSNFPAGYVTTDSSWENLITVGRNATLGWRAPADGGSILRGTGARSLGRTLAATRAFSSCMVQRAFEKVCLKTPLASELPAIEQIATEFESENYSIKTVFTEVSKLCLGE